MKPSCPKCDAPAERIQNYGSFVRKSDSKRIPRFLCTKCRGHFSRATFSSCYRQNKRRLNAQFRGLLCSLLSQRRIALIFGVSRTTVKRKFKFLGIQAEQKNQTWRFNQAPIQMVHIDDLETIEHTKCKPVTVTVAVDTETRKIIDFCVAQIPAKGHLAKIARKKYGKRPDHSRKQRCELFERLKSVVSDTAEFRSDEHQHYPQLIKQHFPKASHFKYKRQEACVAGQGELKKGGYDPLFPINHTLAMMRANINRLIRKTWCTTKKIQALKTHIEIYMEFHNSVLT